MTNGTCDPTFGAVADAFEQVLDGDAGGAAVCVYHRGSKVVDLWGGRRDPAGEPWEDDTLAVSFSTTKGVTATALHMCVDRGLVDYDDPVSKHWPAFAQNGKEAITVRHLLCHEAGLYDVASLLQSSEQLLDWDAMVAALERARPAHEPGTANAYHAVTFGYLVGEVVRRVSGLTITEFVRTQIAEPLGLDGCYVGLPRSELRRVSTLIPPPGEDPMNLGRGEGATPLAAMAESLGIEISLDVIAGALGAPHTMHVMLDPESLLYPIPAANGCFTARSLARMYAALAAGGELDGVRLLSAETLARATEVQNTRPDKVIVFPLHWRLGYHLVFTSAGISERGFGHNGFGGSGAWADPDRGLAAALTLNTLGSAIQGDPRFMSIGGAAMGCADALESSPVPGASSAR